MKPILRHRLTFALAIGGFAIAAGAHDDGASVCDESVAPIVWPLGLDPFEARRLLYSHAQYENHTFWTTGPNVHRGIDIAGEAGELVYAMADGVVDRLYDDSGAGYGYLHIRDTDTSAGSPTMGWKYMHMVAFEVKLEDTVVRDQILGEVVSFPRAKCFDHLHVQRLTGDGVLDLSAKDAGNALILMPSRTDGVRPQRLSFEAPHPPGAGFLFYEDDTSSFLPPSDLAGVPVDIVARVKEVFPGAGAPPCSISACKGPVGPPDIMPMRLTLSIFMEVVTSSSVGSDRVDLNGVYHNTIDLTVPIENSAAGEEFVNRVYDEDSRGDFDDRHYLVRMTNCQETGLGSFTFSASTRYVLQLVLEDASGNASLFERTVDVP